MISSDKPLESLVIVILKYTIWRSSCFISLSAVNVATQGGFNGMSEVQRDDDVGTVLGFLSRVLCMEMY